MKRILSTCCLAPALFTSYNRELRPDAPPDHNSCSKCHKWCMTVDENGQYLLEEQVSEGEGGTCHE